MNPIQEPADPLPLSAKSSFHRAHFRWALPCVITLISTAIAIIWALSDTGHIDTHWGELALVFFTWIAVVMGAWALSHIKE